MINTLGIENINKDNLVELSSDFKDAEDEEGGFSVDLYEYLHSIKKQEAIDLFVQKLVKATIEKNNHCI